MRACATPSTRGAWSRRAVMNDVGFLYKFQSEIPVFGAILAENQ
jgi:hypothetical protein